ncbi:hypothetical protein HYW99_04420 [Candidatus Woesearchaeota archaeon]|nr:hypothetical protein [Candidatus Woesearchaeota archaeon]
MVVIKKEVLGALGTKQGEFSLFALLALLFGSVLIVGAAVLNSTDNTSFDITLNETLYNISSINESTLDNFSLINDSVVENNVLINETANLTTPLETVSVQNQSMINNDTINLTLPIGDFSPNETSNLTSNIIINNQTNTIIPNQSVNLSDELFSLSNITITNYSTTVENLSTKNISKLVKVFNEDNLDFDRELRLKYIEKNNNFSKVLFINIAGKTDFKLNVGAKQDKIRGISINNSNFVIDLLYCEINGRYCTFRINGVPVAKLHSSEEFGTSKQTSFDLDGNYVLKVNSIKFNYCDNRRFCHLGYEGYDIVDVSIDRK